MVDLDHENGNGDSQDGGDSQVTLVGKQGKAHARQLVSVKCVETENGGLSLITVGHDALKMWSVDDCGEKVTVDERLAVRKWRCGVQSVDATDDGRCVVVVGLDSLVHELLLSDEGQSAVAKDIGYMEAWHVAIARNRRKYITMSFSNHVSEVEIGGGGGAIARKAPFQNVKHVSAIAISNDGRRLAVANQEGAIVMVDYHTLNTTATYEVHAMRVRALSFTVDDGHVISGSDDKTLKMHPTQGERLNVARVFCGHTAPVMGVAIARDGVRLASCSSNGTILLWRVDSGEPLTRVGRRVHDGSVTSVCFSPRCDLLFSVGDDRQISVYRLPSSAGRPASPAPIDYPMSSRDDNEYKPMAFDPDEGMD